MPISPSEAARIAAKLSAVPGFPKTADQLEVITDILAERLSADAVHHSALTTKILEDCDFFPGPKSLIALIHQTVPEGRKPRFGCPQCDYTGFVQATLTVGDRTMPASRLCSCRPPLPNDPDEWQPRLNDEGVSGPVASQRALTRAWADDLAKKLSAGVKSLQ